MTNDRRLKECPVAACVAARRLACIAPNMLYRLLFKLLLRRIPPEAAHALASGALRALAATPGARAALRRLTLPGGASLQVRALGQSFPSPLGAAAGVDKQARLFEALGAIGFGFVEVGTATATAQPGQPRPRVWRLIPERGLLNRLGFPNPGAKVIAARLSKRRGQGGRRGRGGRRGCSGPGGRTIVGVNIGKSRSAPLEGAGADYRRSTRELAPFADYLTVNVSSPNTPGLREMQAVDRLRPLLAEITDELDAGGARLPILLKVGPDLSDPELDAIADLAVELRLDGIVAVNTTVSRDGLSESAGLVRSLDAGGAEGGGSAGNAAGGGGGISGAPLRARALEVLQRLYARAGDELLLVSVGGIECSADVWERILAGATLVQAYTGFVYGGPAWPGRMNRALRRRVGEAGVSSIQELVGAGAKEGV